MKKIFSVVLAAVLLLSASSVNAFAAEDAGAQEGENALTEGYTKAFLEKQNCGDVNEDGVVNIYDARNMLRITSKIDEPLETVDYDINKDGKINVEDARYVLRVSAGIELTATKEDVFNYFSDELNSVKKTFPGFMRTATATCTSSKVKITGAPKSLLYDLNADNVEWIDYLKANEGILKLGGKEKYQQMIEEAEAIYEPSVKTKKIEPGNRQHYTYFPVASLANSSRLTFEDIKDINITNTDGHFVITLTLDNYTYDENNPYPATVSEYTERQNIPYGKIFNVPEFSDDVVSGLQKVVLEDGKVVVEMDAKTGEIIDVDYFFRCTSVVYQEENLTDDNGNVTSTMKTWMTTVIEYNEFYDMQSPELGEGA